MGKRGFASIWFEIRDVHSFLLFSFIFVIVEYWIVIGARLSWDGNAAMGGPAYRHRLLSFISFQSGLVYDHPDRPPGSPHIHLKPLHFCPTSNPPTKRSYTICAPSPYVSLPFLLPEQILLDHLSGHGQSFIPSHPPGSSSHTCKSDDKNPYSSQTSPPPTRDLPRPTT